LNEKIKELEDWNKKMSEWNEKFISENKKLNTDMEQIKIAHAREISQMRNDFANIDEERTQYYEEIINFPKYFLAINSLRKLNYFKLNFFHYFFGNCNVDNYANVFNKIKYSNN